MEKEKLEYNLLKKINKFVHRYKLILVAAFACITLLTACQNEVKTLNEIETDNYKVEVVDKDGNVIASDTTKVESDENNMDLELDKDSRDEELDEYAANEELDKANVESEGEVSTFKIGENEEDSLELDILAEVTEIEKQTEEMIKRLKTEDLNQLEMNLLAKDIYQLWDDEINRVWGYLEDELDKDEVVELTTEQREWIKFKEREVEKVGSEYEGGSIRPMIEYLRGTDLTRERVYELIELLK